MYVFIWEQNKTDEKQLDEHVVLKMLHNKRKEKDSDSHIAPNIWYFVPVAPFFPLRISNSKVISQVTQLLKLHSAKYFSSICLVKCVVRLPYKSPTCSPRKPRHTFKSKMSDMINLGLYYIKVKKIIRNRRTSVIEISKNFSFVFTE